ncbi:MAG TPA: phospho-N-acetylmuramoyl-pentapeptide-transferase, partial [Acholeplasmataceae bacterium]|nr:phospho-N-acetylmuramoyl-pentapeptide-transferase [Acholeplasmataceae bacterium]
ATLANLMILLKLELFLILIAFVFVLEALSVIIQVVYFKLTNGKRIFLMSPIHHHFELKGFSELQVDLLFWFMAIISAIITLLLIL